MIRHMAVAAFLGLLSLPALADDCSVTVEANDQMQFDTDAIEISQSCDEFTVNLEHTGSMPVESMGHNWVLTHKDDMSGVAGDGAGAGLDNDHVEPGDDRVIAHTELIGGGESTSVTFAVDQLEEGEDYTFFCSFPGHSGPMQGSVSLVD
ncbi:MAG: azurin [Pseudomonadota bacterium]